MKPDLITPDPLAVALNEFFGLATCLLHDYTVQETLKVMLDDFGVGIFPPGQDPELDSEFEPHLDRLCDKLVGQIKASDRLSASKFYHETTPNSEMRSNGSFAGAVVDFQHFTGRPFVSSEDPKIDWTEFDEDGHRVLLGRVTVRGKPYELMVRAKIADVKSSPVLWHCECEDAKERARREIRMLLSGSSGDDRI